jgi:hypothetical protein
MWVSIHAVVIAWICDGMQLYSCSVCDSLEGIAGQSQTEWQH